MEQHPQARFIVDTLHQAGFIAYYAGGWVRDFLLNCPSDDIDIATNAPPETIQALFPHTVPIGIAFGIILVIIEDHQYEVATFRRDLGYSDGRRPNQIEFTRAEEDAKRRDFTINGMFYDPINGEVLDYVGGKRDLAARVIRAIGDPHERIKEDRLRMIRAIRLSCRFGFFIEEATALAIRAHAQELSPAVAIERIVQELMKGAASGFLADMLLALHDYGLLRSFFPEAQALSREEINRNMEPVRSYPKDAPLVVSLLALVSEKPLEEQISFCKGLKGSREEQRFIEFLHHAREVFRARDGEHVVWAHLYANRFFSTCLEVIAAHLTLERRKEFIQEHNDRMHLLREAIRRIQEQDPVIGGENLKREGVLPGKTMGALLREAERISCNEQLFDAAEIMRRLKNSQLWPR